MKKWQKISLIVLSGILLFLFIFILILSAFEKPEVEVVEYPGSTLSDSVFVSQNMSYTPSEYLGMVHGFYTVPYTADTISGTRAYVNGGTIYKSGDYYSFFSELPYDGDLENTLKMQLCDILSYGCSPDDITVTQHVKQEGYVNGFSAVYHCFELSLKEGVSNQYLLLYELEFDPLVYAYSPSRLLVGAMTPVFSNETFAVCKTVIDHTVLSFQYNDDIADDIEARREAKEDALAEQGTVFEEEPVLSTEEPSLELTLDLPLEDFDVTDDELEEESGGSEEEIIIGGSDATEEVSRSVFISQPSGVLTVTWNPDNLRAEVLLKDISGLESIKPTEVVEGTAVFQLKDMESGVYIVTVSGESEVIEEVDAIFVADTD